MRHRLDEGQERKAGNRSLPSSGSARPIARIVPWEDRKLYDDQPKALQHFYGEVTGMDRALGKLRNTLGDLGVRDNTILWYCSDNAGVAEGRLKPAACGWGQGLRRRPARPGDSQIAGPHPAAAINFCRCSTDIYRRCWRSSVRKSSSSRCSDGGNLVGLIDGKADARP